MLDGFYAFYFSLLAVASVLAFISFKRVGNKFLYLFLVLIATVLFEAAAMILWKYGIKGFTFIYFYFNLVEYAFFAVYYLKASEANALKIPVKLSILLFTVFGFYVSYFVYHFKGLPALNIDVEGFLLFVIYTHLLFTINSKVVILKHPDFWISIGILIFYGGVFVFFGLYPMLKHIDAEKAISEYSFIIRPLNIVFYACLICGFICSIQNRKYLTQ